MNPKKIFSHMHARWEMKRFRIPLYIICFMLLLFGLGQAQFNPVDSSYSFKVGEFYGMPAETVSMPIQIVNPDVVTGFLVRIPFPGDFMQPVHNYYAEFDISGVDTIPTGPVHFGYVDYAGRGMSTMVIDLIEQTIDTSVTVTYDTTTAQSGNKNPNTIFIQFIPPFSYDPDNPPRIPIFDAAGGPPYSDSTVVYVRFLVDPEIDPDTIFFKTQWIKPEDAQGDVSDGRDNQVTIEQDDGTGNITNITIRPATYGDYFTLDTVPDTATTPWCAIPGNCEYGCNEDSSGCADPPTGAPTIAISGSTSYTVQQGEAIPGVAVTATADVIGNTVTLLASNLPTGATFTPSNPVSGTSTVSGTLNWTPSFSQEGTFVINFQATDEDNGLTSNIRSVSVTVEAIDLDRLYSSSSYGASPTGGIPGTTPVIFPIDLVTTKTVYGIQFDMAYPSDVADLDSVTTTSRTPDYIVYDNIGGFPDSVRIMTFGLANEVIGEPDTVSGTAILNAFFSLDSTAVPGDYWVRLHDAWESVSPDPLIPSMGLATDSGVIQVDMLGDVNLDKHINVADPVSIVGYVIGAYSLPSRNYATANVVVDGMVNVVDLVGIVNLSFGLPISPSPVQSNYEDNFASLSVEHGNLSSGQYTKLNVRGEFPDDVAALQMQIDYDPETYYTGLPELAEDAGNFAMQFRDDRDGRIRVVLYNLKPGADGNQIPAGIADIVRIPVTAKRDVSADDESGIRVTQAYLANANAEEIPVENNETDILPTSFTLYQNYPNPFNPSTRIDFDINAGNSGGMQQVKLQVFNILGQQVKTLVDEKMAPGRHTITWNGDAGDGGQVATGIYFYRLEVDDYQQTKKMLLLK